MKNPLRGRSAVLLFTSAVIISVLAGYKFFAKTGGSYENFEEPKMMVVVMEGIPLRRENGEPLDVMVGEDAQMKCQRVSPAKDVGKARFHFDFGDGTVEDHADCDVKHRFAGTPGQIVTVDLTYFVDPVGGGEPRAVDRYRSEMRLVAAAPYFRLKGFGTPENVPIKSVTLPHLVMPYVDSALDLDREAVKKNQYAVAFFVQRDGEDVAYLRVAPPKEGGQGVRAISSPLKYYRDFGRYQGLAAIPDEPIAIGLPEDDRALFLVFAGLFKRDDLNVLLTKCCGAAAGGVVTNTGLRLDEIRPLVVDGRLTEPLRVVRGAREGVGARVAAPPASTASAPPP